MNIIKVNRSLRLKATQYRWNLRRYWEKILYLLLECKSVGLFDGCEDAEDSDFICILVFHKWLFVLTVIVLSGPHHRYVICLYCGWLSIVAAFKIVLINVEHNSTHLNSILILRELQFILFSDN